MTRISTPNTDSAKSTIKFLYSYGGKILPRRTDGKLRYVGGLTRVLSVDRSISFSELMVKFCELCGTSMTLKCKLPNEDLDVLISVASDEDLKNLIDEYGRFSNTTHKDVKITAVLFPINSLKKITPVSSSEDLCSTACKSPVIGARASATCHHRGRYSPCRGEVFPSVCGSVYMRCQRVVGNVSGKYCRRNENEELKKIES